MFETLAALIKWVGLLSFNGRSASIKAAIKMSLLSPADKYPISQIRLLGGSRTQAAESL